MAGIPDFNQYFEQFQSVATLEPGTDQFRIYIELGRIFSAYSLVGFRIDQ
jgi:hypothetical protein